MQRGAIVMATRGKKKEKKMAAFLCRKNGAKSAQWA